MKNKGWHRIPNEFWRLMDGGLIKHSDYVVFGYLEMLPKDKKGWCVVSFATIAEKTQYAKGTACSSIKTLEGMGYPPSCKKLSGEYAWSLDFGLVHRICLIQITTLKGHFL